MSLSPLALDHIREGHRVHAQWTEWVDTGAVTLDEDGVVWVSTERTVLDDSEGDTTFFCQDCAREVEYDDRMELDYS